MPNRHAHIARIALLLYLLAMGVAMILPLGTFSTSLYRLKLLGIRADHIVHAAMFLGLMLMMGLNRRVAQSAWGRSAWLWLGIAVLIAVGSELVQHIVPQRKPSLSDLRANLIGIALGLIPFLLVSRRAQRNRTS